MRDVINADCAVRNCIRVAVGDLCVSNDARDKITIYALGSCIGLAVSDVQARVGGIAHIQLPLSSDATATLPFERRWACADRAVPELLARIQQLGGHRARLRVFIAGGASILDHNNFFQIGHKNHLAVKKILWQAGVFVTKEVVGGTDWRTINLDVGNGQVDITTAHGREVL